VLGEDRPHNGTDETSAIPERLMGPYARTKAEAERIFKEASAKKAQPFDSLAMKSSIDPTFPAEDWQLFSDKEGVVHAVNDLNATLRACYNSGSSKADTYRAMCSVMHHYSKFGAEDTEPIQFLEDILDDIYGEGW
jgi:hypothetical protein